MKNKLNGQSVKNLIIRNAHIVDPANKIDEVTAVMLTAIYMLRNLK